MGVNQISIVGDSGCMLGSIPSAVIAWMRAMGLKRVDVVAWASASAGTLAYYASGQFDEGKQIWTKELVGNDKFLRPSATQELIFRQITKKLGEYPSIRNIFGKQSTGEKGPIMDIDYLVREIFQNGHIALDAESLRKSPIKLIIPVTDAETHQAAFFTNHDPIDIFELFKATMCVPGLYKDSHTIEGRAYYDGAFSAPLPIDHPDIRDTEMIVLLTSPVKKILDTMSATNRAVREILGVVVGPTLGNALAKGAEERYRALIRLKEMELNGEVIVIAPEEGFNQLDTSQKNVDAMTAAGTLAAQKSRALAALVERKKKEGNEFYTTDKPVIRPR